MDEYRLASAQDCEAIRAIYAPYVEHTAISFETEVPSHEAFLARMRGIIGTYPYLVYTRGGQVLGYAYASPFHARAAYRYSADLSIYLREDCHGQGIGRGLYTRLLALLREQGVRNAYGLLWAGNEASRRFHHALGFRERGLLPNAGYKLGQWLDILWVEKQLLPYDLPPEPLRRFDELPAELIRRFLLR